MHKNVQTTNKPRLFLPTKIHLNEPPASQKTRSIATRPQRMSGPRVLTKSHRATHAYTVEHQHVMTPIQKRQYTILVALWILTIAFFWIWWFQAGHIGNQILFGCMTLALAYETTVLPSFYTFFLGWMRRPESVKFKRAEKLHIIRKVAVISLTVPGMESLEHVKRQLRAMKNIRYPHDSWILVDKEHSPAIASLARSFGVKYFSRHDIATWGKERVERWNQPYPPFKAKTKAGNVNSWIDAFGSEYSHFTQLDIDHLPCPAYLDKTLGFFLDPKVKWVQAPSVYGNTENWTARGSAEQEFVLQGPLQMGFFGFCRTPFIIGSHCTYDMQAIREIGGFQPTRAEDHLDTVFLAARGYEGVFLPEIIAVGDGPEHFECYLAQQFAWAYSMIQVFFTYTRRCIQYYTPKQAIQFLFVQTWYTFWSLSMLLLFTLPLISLAFNTPIAHVSYTQFVLHSLPMAVVAGLIWWWSRPWHLPKNLGLSWRGILLHIARWVVVLNAFVQVLLHVQKPYMITVKGIPNSAHRPFPLSPYYPYLFLVAVSVCTCLFYLVTTKHSSLQGNLLFVLQGAAFFLLIYVVALFKDISDMTREYIPFFQCLVLRRKAVFLALLAIISFLLTTAMASQQIIQAICTNI